MKRVNTDWWLLWGFNWWCFCSWGLRICWLWVGLWYQIGADGTDIGLGYQNTIEIANRYNNIAVVSSTSLLKLWDKWLQRLVLPSHNELLEIFYTIGQLSPNGNMANLISVLAIGLLRLALSVVLFVLRVWFRILRW